MKIRIDSILATLASCLLFVGCQDVEEPANTIPSVKTDAVTEIHMKQAYAKGSVSSKSICKFLVSLHPDLSEALEFDAQCVDEVNGTYTSTLYPLTPGTTYYVALSASDGYSQVVGNVETFKTYSALGIESVLVTNWDDEGTNPFSDSPIGTFVYALGEESMRSDFLNVKTTYSDGKWSLPAGYDLGLFSETKRVYAYYPYVEAQDGVAKIPVRANTDVLYGVSQDLNNESPNATIVLKHAMAKVTFEITKAEGATLDVTIGGVNLRNNFEGNVNAIRFDGFLNLFTGAIAEGTVDYGHDGLFQKCEIPVSSETKHAIDFYVIPNSFAANQAMLILYDLNNREHSFTDYLGETVLEAGRHYTYNVIVSPVGLQIGDVHVQEWVNNNGGSITIN